MVGYDFSLEPLAFEALARFDEDDLSGAFGVFARSARAIAEDAAPLRAALPASEGLRRVAREALAAPAHDAGAARRFLTTHFRPFRVRPSSGRGFLTGYYEPWVRGSAAPTLDFTAPILARPADLVTAPAGAARFDRAAAGGRKPGPLSRPRRNRGGSLEPASLARRCSRSLPRSSPGLRARRADG